MNDISRRRFLQSLSVPAVLSLMPAHAGQCRSCNVTTGSRISSQSSLSIRFLKSKASNGNQLLVKNHTGDWLVLGKFEPALINLEGKIVDVNSSLQQQPMTIPPYGVHTRDMEHVPVWQIHNPQSLVYVRPVDALPVQVSTWASEKGGVVQNISLGNPVLV